MSFCRSWRVFSRIRVSCAPPRRDRNRSRSVGFPTHTCKLQPPSLSKGARWGLFTHTRKLRRDSVVLHTFEFPHALVRVATSHIRGTAQQYNRGCPTLARELQHRITRRRRDDDGVSSRTRASCNFYDHRHDPRLWGLFTLTRKLQLLEFCKVERVRGLLALTRELQRQTLDAFKNPVSLRPLA